MRRPVTRAHFALALLFCVVGGSTRGARAQVVPGKVMRSNLRRDDLYRREDVVTVTSVGGTIQSPRFPNAYPRNLLLSWKLLSPGDTRIHLEFDGHFGLEEPENDACRYDFVEVEDILESSTIIWGRWCGQRAPPRLTSKTNALKVTFKSDDYFVAKPGFKIHFSLLSPPASNTNWEAVTLPVSDVFRLPPAATEVPLTVEALDQTIAGFDTVEQLFRHTSPDSWRQDLERLFTRSPAQYQPRAFHSHSRQHKIDLDRLYDDVKRYSCTPRNFSVNLREELRATNAVFFPRCLLVQRCGGNCACGTDHWNGCTCGPARTASKLHEVLKYAPEVGLYQRRKMPRFRWALEEIHLTHHEKCVCVCHSRPPR
ncbi:platelet-derived growth factor D [Aplochiton taeniatus]